MDSQLSRFRPLKENFVTPNVSMSQFSIFFILANLLIPNLTQLFGESRFQELALNFIVIFWRFLKDFLGCLSAKAHAKYDQFSRPNPKIERLLFTHNSSYCIGKRQIALMLEQTSVILSAGVTFLISTSRIR